MKTRVSELSPRQQQIVRELRDGLSDKEIAVKLGIEEQTVKNILRQVYRATDTTNRVGLLKRTHEIIERTA